MVDTTELDKLEELIKSEPLMWKCCNRSRLFDGWQIKFQEPVTGHIISYVCIHGKSYGGLTGMLEQRLLLPDYVDGDFEGWLTAEKVFERWKNYFNREVIPF